MPLVEVLLPGSLLLAKFLLKLFIDRSVNLADLISAVLSLPVDIIFLAASLFAAAVISGSPEAKTGLPAFVYCLVGSILIVAAWRRSDSFFAKDKFWKATILGAANYVVSVMALGASLGMVSFWSAQ